MRKFDLFLLLLTLCTFQLSAQDLNWATVPYTTGSLTADFGIIGNTPSAVTMQVVPFSPIAGDAPAIVENYPAKYQARTAAAPCSEICALRTVVFFTSEVSGVDYTFNFSPAVCGLNFNLLDIDGTLRPVDPGDKATVTADNAGIPQNITITSLDPGGQTITVNGTTSVEVKGNNDGTIDERARVNISGCVSTIKIRYQSQGVSGRSFSIPNMSWASAGPVPVRLVSFSGKKVNNTVQLKWLTENAINLNHFAIERSADGINFRPVGTVVSTGSNSSNYTFTDAFPLANTAFYRLRQVDNDGRFEYSAVVVIKAGGIKGSFAIFPNPADNYIFVSTGENEVMQHVSIIDITGRRVFEKNNPTNKIDITSLPKGFYKLKVATSTGEIKTGSFIKH